MSLVRPLPYRVSPADIRRWVKEGQKPDGEKTFVLVKRGARRRCIAELVGCDHRKTDYGEYLEHILVTIDGVKNFKLGPRDFEWDFKAKETFIFDPSEVPVPVIKDRIGREINIGDFITVAASGARIRLGTVEKITHEGTLTVNALDAEGTFRVPKVHKDNYDNVIIVSKDLKADLMLYKLSR